jgi:hypothetical protein
VRNHAPCKGIDAGRKTSFESLKSHSQLSALCNGVSYLGSFASQVAIGALGGAGGNFPSG